MTIIVDGGKIAYTQQAIYSCPPPAPVEPVYCAIFLQTSVGKKKGDQNSCTEIVMT
jgi:hypothetical protein